ncbi:sugar phosphate nucleotidyltransferase [Haloarchaeobius baliensis]|uniref:sugar phosphate nucleotidyltransferase n=1 Tax=Haloarchaeobius baliensis TaxID=1670458 RepID=UPI003F881F32
MDAVLLAGGYATRLWPLTRTRPKMLLPLGNGTVMDRALSALEAEERVDTVYVSTNARFEAEFERFLDRSDYTKPVLSVEETTGEDEKLGVVGALAQLVDRESVDDDLLVVAGDNVVGFDLESFLDFFEQVGTTTLAAYDVGSREAASAYGLVETDGTRVVDFQEKPADPRSTLVSIACYVFPRPVVGLLDRYIEAGEDPDEPGWFVQWLHDRRPVHAYVFDEQWFDVGTPESYLDAVEWTLDGDVAVAPDAKVVDSELGPNVHVLPGATVVDSELRSTVVFPQAEVRNASLDRSLVDEHARITDIDLQGSLVGQYTELPGA